MGCQCCTRPRSQLTTNTKPTGSKDNDQRHRPISKQKFMEELRRYKKGSVTRRHFLNVTGLGAAAAVMGALFRACARARPLRQVISATAWSWRPGRTITTRRILTPSPRPPALHVQVNVFGSNEEMLAKLQAGRQRLGRLCADQLHHHHLCQRRPDRAAGYLAACRTTTRPPLIRAMPKPASVDGTLYAVPKNWGTTGYGRQHQPHWRQADDVVESSSLT